MDGRQEFIDCVAGTDLAREFFHDRMADLEAGKYKTMENFWYSVERIDGMVNAVAFVRGEDGKPARKEYSWEIPK